MNQRKQYDFSALVIERLGSLVKEMKQLGLANGLREEEIKEVWRTTFKILAQKAEINQAQLSQGIRRAKAKS